MTVQVLAADFRERRVRYDYLGTLIAGWQAMREHRQQRRIVVALSRLGPHLIRDIGLDPELVYEVLDGTWDEIDPASLVRHLPRDV